MTKNLASLVTRKMIRNSQKQQKLPQPPLQASASLPQQAPYQNQHWTAKKHILKLTLSEAITLQEF